MSNAPVPDPVTSAGPSPRRVPPGLVVALAVVVLEALAFIVLGVAELVSLSSARLAMGLSTALFFLGWGALIALCARGMWFRDTWGRSIVVLGQLIQLGVAWSYREATPDLAGVLGLSGLVVLVGIFWPSSLRFLEGDEEAGGDEV